MRTAVLPYLSSGRQKGLALRGSYVSDCLINRIKLILRPQQDWSFVALFIKDLQARREIAVYSGKNVFLHFFLERLIYLVTFLITNDKHLEVARKYWQSSPFHESGAELSYSGL